MSQSEAIRAHAMRVLEVRQLESAYAIIALDPGEPIAAHPGQFVMMRGDWGSAPLLPRPMSLLKAGARVEVLVKVVGEGTRLLVALIPGNSVQLFGPLGTWFPDPPGGRKPVLVAGGVGVAPLWMFAEDMQARGLERPIFLYGGRTDKDLPGAIEIAKIADLRVTTEDGSRGERGVVTAALGPLLGPAAVVYTCGPMSMMAAVARAAQEAGATCWASLEAPMACGHGVCLGCAVPSAGGGYRIICVDGPVVEAQGVAWSGHAN